MVTFQKKDGGVRRSSQARMQAALLCSFLEKGKKESDANLLEGKVKGKSEKEVRCRNEG